MSTWNDPDAWEKARSREECGVCARGVPVDAVAVLEASWVGMPEDGPMRGYCFLMLIGHAVELHDVEPGAAAAFMRDARRVSAAVQAITGAVKMNYEIHGNTVPHLHLHVFPRYPGDPFVGKPIDPRAIRHAVYAPGEHASLRDALRHALIRSAR
ncbi:MAG TPA: HIT family protein [Longimicrobium sp.]|nr:HIT family protein [Longimicrobium sp.]